MPFTTNQPVVAEDGTIKIYAIVEKVTKSQIVAYNVENDATIVFDHAGKSQGLTFRGATQAERKTLYGHLTNLLEAKGLTAAAEAFKAHMGL